MEHTDPLRRLCPRLRDSSELVIVVAHPDDEVIGAGGQLPRWPKAHLVHITDGAPANLADAQRLGFGSRECYAQARRRELEMALAVAGLTPGQSRCLGVTDQQSALQLPSIVGELLDILHELSPTAVLTHPYEGGHPDHDSTAFAVHAACRCLWSRQRLAPTIIEMTSYHNRSGIMQPREFLPRAGVLEITAPLTDSERVLKRRLFDQFSSQQNVLCWFPIDIERFRRAPVYNFFQPPHGGKLYYELFDWGMTGDRWRQLARKCADDLGLGIFEAAVGANSSELGWARD